MKNKFAGFKIDKKFLNNKKSPKTILFGDNFFSSTKFASGWTAQKKLIKKAKDIKVLREKTQIYFEPVNSDNVKLNLAIADLINTILAYEKR